MTLRLKTPDGGRLEILGLPKYGWTPISLEDFFDAVVAKWRHDIRSLYFRSDGDLSQAIDHPAAHTIVNLGWPAVPLILNEMWVAYDSTEAVVWDSILSTITGGMSDKKEDFPGEWNGSKYLKWSEYGKWIGWAIRNKIGFVRANYEDRKAEEKEIFDREMSRIAIPTPV